MEEESVVSSVESVEGRECESEIVVVADFDAYAHTTLCAILCCAVPAVMIVLSTIVTPHDYTTTQPHDHTKVRED